MTHASARALLEAGRADLVREPFGFIARPSKALQGLDATRVVTTLILN